MTAATLAYVANRIIPAALTFLPLQMWTMEAEAELLAIGLQESLFKYRKQVGGPAHGFWQFEEHGGVRGVLSHNATRPLILPILETLCYEESERECYEAIAHNDILACIFARLLLWSSPKRLSRNEDVGWALYLDAWRPGKPRRDSWSAYFAQAWNYLNERDRT